MHLALPDFSFLSSFSVKKSYRTSLSFFSSILSGSWPASAEKRKSASISPRVSRFTSDDPHEKEEKSGYSTDKLFP